MNKTDEPLGATVEAREARGSAVTLPTDAEVMDRLMEIARKTKALFDREGRPYTPQFQSFLRWLAARALADAEEAAMQSRENPKEDAQAS